jgi:hypothetical protein
MLALPEQRIMTADTFRTMALEYPGSVESSHMDHPDFRVGGKIFASLGFPDDGWGMVKLTPEQQQSFVREAPEVFNPCKGAWGRGGSTNVHLAPATKKVLRAAMDSAFQNVAKKGKREA